MILDKISYLRGLFATKQAAGEVSRRWYAARTREPELAADLVRLGGLLVAQAQGPDGPILPDAMQLAYEAGKRDMAATLLAMMSLSVSELNSMMENNDVSDLSRD